MSPFVETYLIVLRELRRNFRSVKGIALAVLSLLGGSGAAMLFVKYQQFKRERLADMSVEQMRALREQAYVELGGYDADTAKSLASSPEVLYAVFILTIWLTPLLIALLGFDNVSSDMQHRAVRYWSVRTRRGSYFAGKFFGLFATVSGITLAMQLIIWTVCIVRGEATAGETFTWGLRLWLTSLPMSAAWCGVATLTGSFFRQPFLALLSIFGAFFGLWFIWVLGNVAKLEPLVYLYPNQYDRMLLSAKPWTALGGLAACLGFAGVTVGGGGALFARRDV
jgi:ABC-type transport system involved in multi-copper enzyme maturation permease subunit